MAAGVTPEIREAWPKVPGRIFFQFFLDFIGKTGKILVFKLIGNQNLFIFFKAFYLFILSFQIAFIFGLDGQLFSNFGFQERQFRI